MKKIISLIISVVILVTAFGGCGESETEKKLELDQTSISMTLYGSASLLASYQNIDGLTWENGNEKVVKTVANGNVLKIYAVGSGIAVITAKGGDLSASCTVSVPANSERLSLSTEGYDSFSLRVGGETTVNKSLKLGGEEFNGATFIYESQDENVVKVDENGKITAVGVGNTKVKVVAEFYGVYSNECSIDVSVKSGPLFSLNTANLIIYETKEGANKELFPDSHSLKVSVIDDGEVKECSGYTVLNSDSGVAVVDNGVIKSVSKGESVLTVSYDYKGETLVAKISVTVKSIPKVSVDILENDVMLFNQSPKGSYKSQTQLTGFLTIDGKSLSSDNLTWSVKAGNDVVSLSDKGLVKALSTGNAEVTASYEYAGEKISDVCKIKVKSPISYMDSHELWDRSAIYSTVYQEATLAYDNLTLSNNQETPIIRLNMIPDKLPLPNETITNNESISTKMLRMVYVKLSEVGNDDNYIIIGLRISYDPDMFTACRIGVRASTYPSFTYGQAGVGHFFGLYGGSNATSECGMGISGARASDAYMSLYGAHLSDVSNTHTVAIALKDTAVYVNTNNTWSKVWDLNADTKAYANSVNNSVLKEDNAWGGFNSDKVNLTVFGDYWYQSWFNVAITDIAGHSVTVADVQNFSIR